MGLEVPKAFRATPEIRGSGVPLDLPRDAIIPTATHIAPPPPAGVIRLMKLNLRQTTVEPDAMLAPLQEKT